MKFKLRFPGGAIAHWAEQYPAIYDDEPVVALGEVARATGYLTREQFLNIAEWKTKRSKSRCRKNSEEFVRAVTSSALASDEPRFKIEVLRLLDGVDWATASVVLHFCDREKWPILDFRAFWSLGEEVPRNLDFDSWQNYTSFTRELAQEWSVSMRTLDMALWSYSKVNQKPA